MYPLLAGSDIPATGWLLQQLQAIQASKYFLNNYWLFNTGNQPDETGAFATFISLLEGPQLAVSGSYKSPKNFYKKGLLSAKSRHGEVHQKPIYKPPRNQWIV